VYCAHQEFEQAAKIILFGQYFFLSVNAFTVSRWRAVIIYLILLLLLMVSFEEPVKCHPCY
jgi:hypothetical protein